VPLVARSLAKENRLPKYQYSGALVRYNWSFGTIKMLTVVLAVGGQLRYCGIGHGYDDIKVMVIRPT
jgi:hypothetical protein